MSAIDDNKEKGSKVGGMPPGSSKRDLLETVNEEYTELNQLSHGGLFNDVTHGYPTSHDGEDTNQNKSAT